MHRRDDLGRRNVEDASRVRSELEHDGPRADAGRELVLELLEEVVLQLEVHGEPLAETSHDMDRDLTVVPPGFEIGVFAVHLAFDRLLRSDPLNSLPPDLVIVETTPPVKRPYSAEMPPVMMVVSWIASSINSESG